MMIIKTGEPYPTWSSIAKASCRSLSANCLLLTSNDGRDILSPPGAMPL